MRICFVSLLEAIVIMVMRLHLDKQHTVKATKVDIIIILWVVIWVISFFTKLTILTLEKAMFH